MAKSKKIGGRKGRRRDNLVKWEKIMKKNNEVLIELRKELKSKQ
jgi:hypothetical protein